MLTLDHFVEFDDRASFLQWGVVKSCNVIVFEFFLAISQQYFKIDAYLVFVPGIVFV
jgi:hypothetical protein